MISVPKVIFFKVKDNQTKVRMICQFVQDAFLKQKKILLTVPNEEGAKYLDALLWRLPEESFIPHSISNRPSKEGVIITILDNQNVNQAQCLLNLNPSLSPIFQQFEEILEFYDETHPQKIQQAQSKIEEYKSKGLEVIIR